MFENDVKMYGTQTPLPRQVCPLQFENDVKMYGTQTPLPRQVCPLQFENDVKMYGTQTGQIYINGINILLINF